MFSRNGIMGGLKMKKWYMIIDIEKCEDCNNCFMACKDEYVGNDFPPYSVSQPLHGHRWMNIMRKEKGSGSLIEVAYCPTPCMHCEDPVCIKASEGSITKRSDGIVIIDPVKSKNKKHLVEACPYNAIWWNEDEKIPQKCDFCAHLIDDGWNKPRCVQACATGALTAVSMDENEMRKYVDENGLEVLHPEFNSKPQVYYKNLHKYTKSFIAGSVCYIDDNLKECAKDASIKLTKDNMVIGETSTDYFGDFKFEHLEDNSGKYELMVNFKRYPDKNVTVDLKESVNIGDICLNE